MGKNHEDGSGPQATHASPAQLYAAAAVQTAAGNHPSTTGSSSTPLPHPSLARPAVHSTRSADFRPGWLALQDVVLNLIAIRLLAVRCRSCSITCNMHWLLADQCWRSHAAVTALFNDLVSHLRGRNAERSGKSRDGRESAEQSAAQLPFDKEAQAAAAAELRQDAADERGHAVRCRAAAGRQPGKS